MKRVVVFGNTGGGKSTLAKQLAQASQLPLFSLDQIQYQSGDAKVPHAGYLKVYADILK